MRVGRFRVREGIRDRRQVCSGYVGEAGYLARDRPQECSWRSRTGGRHNPTRVCGQVDESGRVEDQEGKAKEGGLEMFCIR